MGLHRCFCLGGRLLVILFLNVAVSGTSATKLRISETALEQTRTSPIYRSRLRAGWDLLRSWLTTKQLSSLEWTKNVHHTNQILAEFVQEMHDGNDTKSWIVRRALLDVQTYHRSLQGLLRRP